MTTKSVTGGTAGPISDELRRQATLEARRLGKAVYIVGGVITHERPRQTAPMVWPSGSLTWGNPQAASRQIDKRHLPPRHNLTQ